MGIREHLQPYRHPAVWMGGCVGVVALYLFLETLNELQQLPDGVDLQLVGLKMLEFGAILAIVLLGVMLGVVYSKQAKSK